MNDCSISPDKYKFATPSFQQLFNNQLIINYMQILKPQNIIYNYYHDYHYD